MHTAGVEFGFIVITTLLLAAFVTGLWALVDRWSWGLFSVLTTLLFVGTVIGYSWLEVTGITEIREFFRYVLT